MKPIYLDYNATTPVDPAVIQAMLPYLGSADDWRMSNFGNPSSAHHYGHDAHAAIDQARRQVAELLGAQPDEIVFTGCGTEATNLALKGVAFRKLAAGNGPPHIITSAIEHPATLQPCSFLQKLGCKVTFLPVDKYGLVDPDGVRGSITKDTAIISIMHANNEVGTLQPICDIAAIARQHGLLLHADAAQSIGKVPVNVDELDIDLLTVAGHKLYAPKGIGVLYVRRGVQLEPLLHGAGHEGGRRAGTENVPYIVGLGAACELAQRSLPTATHRLRELRDRLWQKLSDGLQGKVVVNGHPERRLPNTLNVSFIGHIGADLLQNIPEIAASTGSACHEGSVTQSPVLTAMGVSPEVGRGAIRLTVGRFTTESEIDQAAELLIVRARGKSNEE